MALALGCTVKELLHRLDGAELVEWMAYDQLEPFGEDRADIRAAIVASTVANCHGNKTRLRDFLPRWEKPAPLSWEQVRAGFNAFVKKG